MVIPLPLLWISSFQTLTIKVIVLNPKFHPPSTLGLISISFQRALNPRLIPNLKLCTLSLGTLYIKNKQKKTKKKTHRSPQIIFCASFHFLALSNLWLFSEDSIYLVTISSVSFSPSFPWTEQKVGWQVCASHHCPQPSFRDLYPTTLPSWDSHTRICNTFFP